MVKVSPWVTKQAVKDLITENVATGGIMVTDGYAIYAYLKNSKEFTHVVVDHSKGEYVKGGFHTNGIENFWSILKRGISLGYSTRSALGTCNSIAMNLQPITIMALLFMTISLKT